MDNLPVNAVALFLSQAARDAKIVGRPHVAPHLLFTASLEITRDVLPMNAKAIGETRRNFFSVRRRAKTFNLNRKIDAYRAVQSRLDALWKSQRVEKDWPLNLRVIAVKPNWLCNTFGFHPMLGFRRRKQAQSIAHGCATTLPSYRITSSDILNGSGHGELKNSTSTNEPRCAKTFREHRKTNECSSRGETPETGSAGFVRMAIVAHSASSGGLLMTNMQKTPRSVLKSSKVSTRSTNPAASARRTSLWTDDRIT